MNVTDKFETYKEATRHLWNAYFYKNGTATWNDEEIFQEIDTLLFGKIVLDDIDATKAVDYETASKMFRLQGRSNGLPIMVNRTGEGGYWDHPVTALVHDEYEIQFDEYFDWNQLGVKDCRYIMCRILFSKNHAEIIGHKALVETQYVDILLKTRS